MPQTITIPCLDLVAAAEAEVKTIDVAEAQRRIREEGAVLVDLRDIRELSNDGRIPGAFHCPRGLLEFWIDPESPYHEPFFAGDGPFIFFCGLGWRSALAAKVAADMGLSPVFNLAGGFEAWVEAGAPAELPKSGAADSA